MKYDKKPKTIDESIELLIERKLLIDNTERAKKYLSTIGYFRLTGYMFHLQSKDGNHTFDGKTSFNDIINLYKFDKELRAIFLEYLERIEICLRAKLTNTYSLKYGFLWYANKDLFQDDKTYEEINNEIRKEFENPKERFLKSFKNRYVDDLPPSNMALETLSLGKLSRLYKGLKNDELKIGIASEFNLISSILSSFLIYLSHVRNICAHHSRLWNKKITVDRPIMPNRKEYKFKGTNFEDTNTTVYGIISILNRLLSSFNNDNNFTSKVEKLIKDYNINPRLMGFPDDWENNANWKM